MNRTDITLRKNLDILTKVERQDINIMLRLARAIYGEGRFILIKNASTDEWEIVANDGIPKGNAGLIAYERRVRGYASDDVFNVRN